MRNCTCALWAKGSNDNPYEFVTVWFTNAAFNIYRDTYGKEAITRK